MAEGKSVILAGEPGTGFEIIGPFDSGVDAVDWATDEIDELTTWWVMPIREPDDPEADAIERVPLITEKVQHLDPEKWDF